MFPDSVARETLGVKWNSFCQFKVFNSFYKLYILQFILTIHISYNHPLLKYKYAINVNDISFFCPWSSKKPMKILKKCEFSYPHGIHNSLVKPN